MVPLALLVVFLVSSGQAVHEDVVDKILASVSGKFGQVPAPYYQTFFTQHIASAIVRLSVMLRNGKMSVGQLTRNGDVEYTTDDAVATFKVNAKLVINLDYTYSISSSSQQASAGSASGNWASDVDLVITAKSSGGQLELSSSRKTTGFDLLLNPNGDSYYPLAIHFPAGDVIENRVLPTFNTALSQASDGWHICDIISCA